MLYVKNFLRKKKNYVNNSTISILICWGVHFGITGFHKLLLCFLLRFAVLKICRGDDDDDDDESSWGGRAPPDPPTSSWGGRTPPDPPT